MGMADGVKKLYYSLEDMWYGALDRVNKIVPVYAIVDPIDKLLPSFLIFALAIIVGVAAISSIILLAVMQPATANVTIFILDEDNKPIDKAHITIGGLESPLVGKSSASGEYVLEVPRGTNLEITVKKTGFETTDVKKLTVDRLEKELYVSLRSILPAPVPKTIKFVGPGNKSLSGHEISADFGCSSGLELPQSHFLINSGELTITPPRGCGTLTVQVSASGYLAKNYSIAFDGIIKLDALEIPKGTVLFNVKDIESKNPIDGIVVRVKDGSSIVGEGTTVYGQVFFTIPEGSYSAVFDDPAMDYASTTRSFSVFEGGTESESVELTKEIKAIINIYVKDSDTLQTVPGASVSLRDESGNFYGPKEVDENGSVVQFILSERDVYYARAAHEDYQFSDENVIDASDLPLGTEMDVTVLIEECGATNCGIITVTVIDEDKLPVENATVSIYDSNTHFWVDVAGTRATDVNGITRPSFSGVRAGSYYALAQKYPAQGTSDAMYIDTRNENEFTINMYIGEGIIQVQAVDEDGGPVSFGNAEIRELNGDVLGTIALDAGGSGEYALKADKEIYIKVYKDGFVSWYSAAIRPIADSKIIVRALMKENILGSGARIILEGIYSQSTGAKVEKLESGHFYDAHFRMEVPGEEDFESMGAHIRAGDTDYVETDQIFINRINAPNASVLKGTTYNPPRGEGTDLDADNITNGDAKWANVVWSESDIEPAIYNFEVELKIRTNTTQGYELPFNYRGWSVDSGGSYSRDPEDLDLGNAESNGAKDALYATTYDKLYYEGADQSCDDDFCFGNRVIDTTEGLNLTNVPYQVRIFDDYELHFSVTNISQILHDDAVLYVRNSNDGTGTAENISIESYEITNADAQSFSGEEAVFELPDAISLGYFSQGKTIQGKLVINSKELGPSGIQIYVVSDGSKVFDDAVSFDVISSESLAVIVTPDVFASNTEIDANVHVMFASGTYEGFDVEDALVNVTRIAPDKSETFQSDYTDSDGNAYFVIPASSPGTKVRFNVELAGFASETVEKLISDGVVLFEPNEIESELNLTNTTEELIEIKITNLIPQRLKIAKMSFGGSFDGLIDKEKMNNYLQQYFGLPLDYSQREFIDIKSVLTEDAQQLTDPLEFSGKLFIDINSYDDSTQWNYALPYEVEINLAELPSEECLSVSINEWDDSTEEENISKEFVIENNCRTENGEPMNLKDLQARLLWKSNSIGYVEMSVTAPDGGTSVEVLKDLVWTDLFTVVEKEGIYSARLTFMPKPGHLGESAEFDVEINAELLTNTGEQFIGDAQKISVELLVINLSQCIKINPNPQHGIEIDRSEDDDEFTIDASDCGDIEIDYRFCSGDPESCGGGSVGGINIHPNSYTNQPSGELVTATVSRQSIPGMYGITVDARPEGGSFREIAIIDTLIHPREGKYFTLDRYDFHVIGTGAQDSTTLYNEIYQESVSVKADLCDWDEASSDSGFDGEAALVGAAVGQGAVFLTGFGSVIGPSIMGVGFCPPCLVVVVLFAIIAALLSSLFGDDPCDDYMTESIYDFVINLSGTSDRGYAHYIPPDAREIIMDKSMLKADWMLDVRDLYGEGIQEVGIVFENLGMEEQKPTYSIGTIIATEHVHGDPTHGNSTSSYDVKCNNGNFGQYWIGPNGNQGSCSGAYDTEYQQRIHLRFRSMDMNESLPEIAFDSFACDSGTTIGRSGPGALPRVKMNWDWNEPKGIAWNECDYGNSDYIYCDATQFTIEVSKKLAMLEEFFAANNYEFDCPETISEADTSNSTNTVAVDSVGLSEISVTVNGNDITVVAKVMNNTSSEQDATVSLGISGTDIGFDSCTGDAIGVPGGGGSSNVSCNFTNLPDGIGAAVAEITSSTATNIDSTNVEIEFEIGANPTLDCQIPRTTETLYGEPAINKFIDVDDTITWTNSIPNKQALNDLTNFKAYLIKDGYSEDFRQDFAEYYTTAPLFDVDASFKELKLDEMLDDGTISFTQKYVDSSQLPSAGIYDVEIGAYFDEDWRFLNPDDEIAVLGIVIVLYLVDDPSNSSPFYNIPLDGQIGLVGNDLERQGYGVSFDNENSEELITFNEGETPMMSYIDAGSNAVIEVDAEKITEFYKLNTSPGTRGNLLSVETVGANRVSINYSPSHATPLMLKMYSAMNEEPFGAFYGVTSNSVPIEAGETLTYWGGAGNCLNFSGVPVYEAFDYAPDRAANEGDLLNWENSYGVDWDNSIYTGDVYLRTIIYGNQNDDLAIHAEKPLGDLSFLTPDQTGEGVSLNGISTMPYNRLGSGENDLVNSIEDIFNLVEEGNICVTSTGNKAEFWWNPKAIYEYMGNERSIHDETVGLVSDSTCIGYGS